MTLNTKRPEQETHGRKWSVAACQWLGGSSSEQTPPPPDTCHAHADLWRQLPKWLWAEVCSLPRDWPRISCAWPTCTEVSSRLDRRTVGRTLPRAHTWLCSGWRRHLGGLRADGTPDPGPPWAALCWGAEEPHAGRRSGEVGGIGEGQEGLPRLGSSSRVPDPGATSTCGHRLSVCTRPLPRAKP